MTSSRQLGSLFCSWHLRDDPQKHRLGPHSAEIGTGGLQPEHFLGRHDDEGLAELAVNLDPSVKPYQISGEGGEGERGAGASRTTCFG